MVAATEMVGAEAAEEAAALWVVMAACKEVRAVRAATTVPVRPLVPSLCVLTVSIDLSSDNKLRIMPLHCPGTDPETRIIECFHFICTGRFCTGGKKQSQN